METRGRKHGCRFSTDYSYRGLQCLVVENELLRLTYLLDKGADLIELRYKPRDIDLMYSSPNGVTNPALFAPSIASRDGSFVDLWPGGWQEVFPAGGHPAVYEGAEHGTHGEVALLRWDASVVRDEPDEVSVRLSVRTHRSPFLLQRTVTLRTGSATVHLDETVTNEGAVPLHVMWGQHPCFGAPFLDENCVIEAPARTVVTPEPPVFAVGRARPGRWQWPIVPGVDGDEIDLSRVLAPSSGVHDGAYLTDFTSGWCAIVNRPLRLGVALTWPVEVFPWMWLWQVYGGQSEAPSYGRTYTVALEPFTSFPNDLSSAIEAGTSLLLEPGQTVPARLGVTVFEGDRHVERIDREGNVILSET